jgi:hypothetical protein
MPIIEKQPVTNFPCTSFTGQNSVLSSQNRERGVVEACTEKGIVGKGKGCYTLIQGVTAPLNCRVFINPRSYVVISSSIPLCQLQLSDKHFRKIYNHLKANLQQLDSPSPSHGSWPIFFDQFPSIPKEKFLVS